MTDFYAKKLSDSSYDVCALALRALNLYLPRQDSAKLLAMTQSFAHTKWPAIALELANIYCNYPSYAQSAFYHRMPYYIHSAQMTRMTDAYKKWLFALPADDIARESSFILHMDSFIKDVWSAASYKVFLQEAATHLEKLAAGNITYNTIIQNFRTKADGITLTSNY